MKQDLLSCIYNFFTFTFLINLKGVGRFLFFINGFVYIQPMGFWSKSQLLENGIGHRNHLIKKSSEDFPGGTVVKNLPANAADTGSSPGPGRSHMPRSN